MKTSENTAKKIDNSTSKDAVLTVSKPSEKKFNPTETETIFPLVEQNNKPQEKETKKEPTLQELKDRATVLFLLQEKHTQLIQKRTDLERFVITHDNNRAVITVEDANGEEFTSHSPKSIGKLVEFWKEEFETAIKAVEKELIEKFNFSA